MLKYRLRYCVYLLNINLHMIHIYKICIIYNTTIIGISRLIEKIHILF